MHYAAQEPFAGGGDGAGEIGESSQGITMQTPGQSDQKSHQRTTQQTTQYGTDGPGVGDGVINVEADIGAKDAKAGKNNVYQYLVR